MIGVDDIDRFTLGSCQLATVQALLDHDPELALPPTFAGRLARLYARLRCREVWALID